MNDSFEVSVLTSETCMAAERSHTKVREMLVTPEVSLVYQIYFLKRTNRSLSLCRSLYLICRV